MKKIGIVGYGGVGQFLSDKILNDKKCKETMQLAFVWNRTADKLQDGLLSEQCCLSGDLREAFESFVTNNEDGVDIVVEVAHPDIVSECGALFLEHADLYASSLTAFADANTEKALLAASGSGNYGLYIPTGAGWGVTDIIKMDELGTLRGLRITMQFNAHALRLKEPLKSRLEEYIASPKETAPLILHDGNIRDIAAIAPNNVNTMICLALAGRSVGLDDTVGCLIAQKEHDAHIVDIEITGPDGFFVKTTRHNPAKRTAVTGMQTYNSFLSSLMHSGGRGPGVHFC